MKVGIIGAGRVGTAFALALANAGMEISGIYSRSLASLSYLSGRLGVKFDNDLGAVIRESEILLLTVSDTVIADMAEKICQICPDDIDGRTFLHCSGALTSAELSPLHTDGGFTGSLHPIQSFAAREDGWKAMEGIFFGFEGMPEAREKAAALVEALKGTILDIKAEAKPLYHAAACILSNYTVALSYVAGILLNAAGIEADTGIKAFMPLLRNTVENIASSGSLKALTGPISRGDAVTVEGHLGAMKGKGDDITILYRVLGVITVKMALEKGTIDKMKADQIMAILSMDD